MNTLEEYLEALKKYSFNPEATEHIYLQMVEYFKVYYHEGATNAKIDYYKDYAEQLQQETILDLINYCETERSIIHTQVENVEYGRFIAFGEILNKLKGDDKEC